MQRARRPVTTAEPDDRGYTTMQRLPTDEQVVIPGYFVFHYAERGLAVHAQVIERAEWVAARIQALPPHARRPLVQRELPLDGILRGHRQALDAFLAAIHPDDRAAVDLAYGHSVATREPYEIQHRLQMPDGRIKFVHEEGQTFYGVDGAPLRSVGTVQDHVAPWRSVFKLNQFTDAPQWTTASTLAASVSKRACPRPSQGCERSPET